MATAVALDEKMREIVDDAISAGCGTDERAILRLALEDWWSERLIQLAGRDEVKVLLEEAIADTRPGVTLDEVFGPIEAELNARLHERAHAA